MFDDSDDEEDTQCLRKLQTVNYLQTSSNGWYEQGVAFWEQIFKMTVHYWVRLLLDSRA